MEPLTWSGAFGAFLNPLMLAALVVFVLGFLSNFVMTLAGLRAGEMVVNADHTLTLQKTPIDYALMSMKYAVLLSLACCVGYIVAGLVLPSIEQRGIIAGMAARFVPVWIALVAVFALSITFKRRLGLYGKLFDSLIGMVGFGLVMFWVFTAVFAGMVATHGPIDVISQMRNEVPGSPLPSPGDGVYAYYLLGGDNLGRDVFSRMVMGARDVLSIAPLATLFAFMVGVTLGLPAGYFGGKLDTIITFIANLVLAFPVILLFYLLVTPEIVLAGVPQYMSMVLFIFPIIFLVILFNSRFHTQPPKRALLLSIVLAIGSISYFSLISDRSDPDAPFRFWPEAVDLFDIPGNLLIVFVSVVFVNSPT
ncbi:MAG: ABC transporter permease, partial [Roseicyclus sp.]